MSDAVDKTRERGRSGGDFHLLEFGQIMRDRIIGTKPALLERGQRRDRDGDFGGE